MSPEFGLYRIPKKPAPNYRRLSRYDETGLIWLLRGRPVVALVELHRDWALIELGANGSRHVFERRRVDAGRVTLPWIERRRRPGGRVIAAAACRLLPKP
jgi:hypothetical protein